jgi:DNA repair photolyase
MRVQGGLQPEDWLQWGQFTTFKRNAATLLERQVRANQIIYCSPLVDPYQPGEESERLMPRILAILIRHPPKVFVIQTRSPLVSRDCDLLVALAQLTRVRISFSITTNLEEVRRLYEPRCASIRKRLDVMQHLRAVGLDVYPTLAPLLPCNPEVLARKVLQVTVNDVIGDPLHVRTTKKLGATTADAGWKVSLQYGYSDWHNPARQEEIVKRIGQVVSTAGRRFYVGTKGFGRLAIP